MSVFIICRTDRTQQQIMILRVKVPSREVSV